MPIHNPWLLAAALTTIAAAFAAAQWWLYRDRNRVSMSAWYVLQVIVLWATFGFVTGVIPGVISPGVRTAQSAVLVLFVTAAVVGTNLAYRREVRRAKAAWAIADIVDAHHGPHPHAVVAAPRPARLPARRVGLLPAAAPQAARERACATIIGHCYHIDAGALIDWWCCICGGAAEGMPPQRCKICLGALAALQPEQPEQPEVGR